MTARGADRRRRRTRRAATAWVAAGALAVAAVASGLLGAPPAAADGPTTFSNPAMIAIPAAGSPDETGPVNPYPSTVTVSGMAGPVTDLTVSLNGLTHGTVSDIDVMLVAPTGENLVLLSDVADGGGFSASNVTVTLDDAAPSPIPSSSNVVSGTYRPTNAGGGDAFPAPAPTPSTSLTLAGAFTGVDPNGEWQLFIVDDAAGDSGSLAGGWSLTITTDAFAIPTSTVVVTSGTPSTTGDQVTFTASVSAEGSPVTTGLIQFTDGGEPLGVVPVNASGQAQLATSALDEGTHRIYANFTGASGLLRSSGNVSHRVDNATIVTGDTYCNPGPIEVPPVGVSDPYPSNVTVSGATGDVLSVTATVSGLSHTYPQDLDVMLSGPVPTTNVVLMSDVGGTTPVADVDLTFDDLASSGVPTPIVSGTHLPTNAGAAGEDVFSAPAPAVSGATTLSTFAGAAANGTWTLWIVDDANGDAGGIAGGWCLTIVTQDETSTSLTSSLNPSVSGDSVTFTATVTAGGDAVTGGSVEFTDDGIALASPVPLAADGTATLTTSALAVGTHPITATYSGAAAFAGSSADLDQVVDPIVVADAGGPYAVAEGDALALDGSASSPGATYEWDVNADADYSDAVGVSPSLTWAQLEALGVDDGPASLTVSVRVTLGSQSAADSAVLDVGNTAPAAIVTGDLTATAGIPFTLKVGADDPSAADMAGLFTYTVDWGDGSEPESVIGPADPPVTHTYAAAGEYSATFSASDKDGGAGAGTAVLVQVQAGSSPSPTPPAGSAALPPTGAEIGGTLAAGAGALVIGLVLFGGSRIAARRR